MTTPTMIRKDFTTNNEDKDEVAKLQARLKHNNKNSAIQTRNTGTTITESPPFPSVDIANGVHKYVLMKAEWEGEEEYIVTSKKGAAYHRNTAEPMITKLQNAGYTNIEVTGGGRISFNNELKEISIYGFSYGFGPADHTISQRTIQADPRYSSFSVTYSNEGY